MSDVTSDRITIACGCGAKLKVPASAAGRKAKCPKCGERFTVPTPAPVPAAHAAGDLLDDLAAMEQSGSASAGGAAPGATPMAASAPRPCPQCGATLLSGAVLCTSCGFNTKTGRKLKAAATGPSTAGVAPGAAVQVAKLAGPFVLGCVLSCVAAGIGAFVWFFIAMQTGYEIGWLAWGIGLLVGFGMALGSRSSGTIHGAVAGLIAFGSIVAAKMLIFGAIIYGAATGDTSNHEIQQIYVTTHLAQESLREKGIDPEDSTEAQWDAAYADAEGRVLRMSKAEFERNVETYREADRLAEEEEEESEAAAEEEVETAEAPAATPGADTLDEPEEEVDGAGIVAFFFKAMFGPLDIVFVLLALGTAWKVGGSGLSFGGS